MIKLNVIEDDPSQGLYRKNGVKPLPSGMGI